MSASMLWKEEYVKKEREYVNNGIWEIYGEYENIKLNICKKIYKFN